MPARDPDTVLPSWAPPTLIEDYRRAVLRDQEDRDLQSDPGDLSNLSEILPGIEPPSPNGHDDTPTNTEILHKLLTAPDMEKAWATLYRHPPSPLLRPRFAKQDPAEALWTHLGYVALPAYRKSSRRTFAAKRDALTTISRQIRDLKAALLGDVDTERMATFFLRAYLGSEHVRCRAQDLKESVRWYEYDVPDIQLSEDARDARAILSDIEDSPGKEWRERSTLERFAYWTSAANDTSLIDVLTLLADAIEANAHVSPIIKQPGRDTSALRPYVIRNLLEWMNWRYGRPLDDTVARIVTSMLDLDPPLSRDDVRPYREKKET